MAAYEINRNYATRVCVFVIDSDDDLAILPTSTQSGKESLSLSTPCRMGSMAKMTDGTKAYMLDGKDTWVRYTASTGGGIDPEEEIEPIDDSTIESLFD